MPELILDFGDDQTDGGALLREFCFLGSTVVFPVHDEGSWLPGRFDGVVGMRLETERRVRRFLECVERCRPEWFALDQCLAVALDGYGVQRLTVNRRSLQFGHRSSWVLDANRLLEATPEQVAMAIAERRPATEETAAVPGKPAKVVTLPAAPTNPAFAGGKGGAGVWQAIVNQMPPHDVYVEGCLGRGAVMRHKRPAGELSVGVESDGDVIRAHWQGFDGVPGLRVIEADVRAWLRNSFGVGQVPGACACVFCGARRLEALSGGSTVLVVSADDGRVHSVGDVPRPVVAAGDGVAGDHGSGLWVVSRRCSVADGG